MGQFDQQPAFLEARHGPQDRNRSIIAALDWSYNLLDPRSQASLRRLCDASLLVPPSHGAGYRMLEPVRHRPSGACNTTHIIAPATYPVIVLPTTFRGWDRLATHLVVTPRSFPKNGIAPSALEELHAYIVERIRLADRPVAR